jgi:F420-dependent methylenetetrahydromethanopterin dehydrogenase
VRDVRILIGYEDSHRVYADAMQRSIRGLRPGAEVAACGLAELGARVESFDPDLVVSSRPNTVDPGGRTAWYVLSADPDEPSEVCVEGRRREVETPGMEELLSILDQTEESVRTGRGLGDC